MNHPTFAPVSSFTLADMHWGFRRYDCINLSKSGFKYRRRNIYAMRVRKYDPQNRS